MVQLVSGLAPFFPELCSLGWDAGVGEELVNVLEPVNVANLRHEGRGGGWPDAGDGHEATSSIAT